MRSFVTIALFAGTGMLAACGSSDTHRRVHPATDAGADGSTVDAAGSGGHSPGEGGAGGSSGASPGGSDAGPTPFDAGSSGSDSGHAPLDGSAGSDAGRRSADASVDAALDAAPDAGCETAPGGADQSQLQNSGYYGLSTTQVVGQSFTAGQTGQLTGIEVPLAWYYCTPPGVAASGSIALTLTDSNGVTLGSTDIPISSFGTRCANTAVTSGAPGVFYIDLSSQCIQVESEMVYTFTFTSLLQPGVCAAASGLCTGGLVGNSCELAEECDFTFGVGESLGDSYSAGTAIVNGSPAGNDLNFRTFVK